jgi:hypothetical protein
MAETSYPVAGGGSVTDWNYEKLLGDVLGSGVIGAAGQTVLYGDSTGRQVKVAMNKRAFVRGFMWESDVGIIRSIAANASGNPRVDLGVLRLDRSNFTVRFQVKQGTPAGSPSAPALTQQDGPSGVWEIPLGTIAVANGAATITAGNVVATEWYLSPSSIAANAARSITLLDGQVRGNTDGTAYVGANGSKLIYEDTGWLSLSASGGWSTNYIRYRRRNGLVHIQASTQRSGADLAASTDSATCVIPSGFRPTHDVPILGYIDSANLCHGDIRASDGGIWVNNYNTTINTGRHVTWHAITYPLGA